MKKTIILLFVMLFIFNFSLFADKEIADSEITAITTEYEPGTTVDLYFHLSFYSSDYEWLDGAYLDFPTGVTVNTATDIGYLSYNNETGDGVQVTWGDIIGGSGYGDQSSDADFSVNVTISSAKFSGDMNIEWFLVGDGYGDDPHQVTGTMTIPEAVVGAPGDPTNSSPVDGATGVAVDGTLTWDFGSDTETYDLWFGEAGNMSEVVTGATAGATGSYSYSGLSNSTEYEWQVICHNSTKLTTDGPVWSFQTQLPAGLVQIGTGTAVNESLPIEPYYGYDYTQSIYLSSEFSGVAADQRIEKLYYNYTKTSTSDYDEDDWAIWIGTTTETNLDAGYIDVSTLTQVFDGSVGFGDLPAGEGWLEINLTNPFIYNPVTDGNLVIAVYEYTPSYTSNSDEFYCDQDTRANVSVYYHNDSTNPDPTDPPEVTNTYGGAYHSTYYPNTRFFFNDVPTTPVFAIDPESKDFGTVNVGTTSAAQTFTISNTGGSTLSITDVSLTGTDATEFELTDVNIYPNDLGAGESITVDVAFAPTEVGEKTAELSVESDAKVIHTATLTGIGYNPNYGGGGAIQGGYFYANSLPGAAGAPSQPTYDWIDISTTGTDVYGDLTGGDGYAPNNDIGYPIGFTFTFFGNDYTNFWVGADGFIKFASSDGDYSNDPIPTATEPNDIIALFWDDLNPSSPAVNEAAIYYQSFGDKLVITFEKMEPYSSSAATKWFTAQAILYQNGNIKLQYKEKGADMPLDGCTVGIENAAGDAGVQYLYNGTGGEIYTGTKAGEVAVMFGKDESSLPVVLSEFTATFDMESSLPILSWVTQSETDNAGWNVYRGDYRESFNEGNTVQVNQELILGAGTTSQPSNYSFQDPYGAELIAGEVYWYYLESVNNSGESYLMGSRTLEVPEEVGEPPFPTKTTLNSNYPNPFNPVTIISFSIKENETGHLSIYNIKGQLVETNKFEAGEHKYEWDSKDNASGVYFYKLETNSYNRIRKMLLLK